MCVYFTCDPCCHGHIIYSRMVNVVTASTDLYSFVSSSVFTLFQETPRLFTSQDLRLINKSLLLFLFAFNTQPKEGN